MDTYEGILDFNQVEYTRARPKRSLIIRYRFRLTMISLSSTLEHEFDDYVTVRRLNQFYLYLAPKLKKGDNLSFHKVS